MPELPFGITYIPDPRWYSQAACRGTSSPEDFFPEKEEYEKMQRALRVCRGCMVKRECLLEALTTESRRGYRYTFGIRGGWLPWQRNRWLRHSRLRLVRLKI